MKKIILPALMLLLTGNIFAQGIKFEKITFEQALKKAAKQDKLIFIDFYTQWCGPCKALARGPFKDDKLGAYYNKNFINLKLDAEKEGEAAAKKFRVNAYPTLLFVNEKGEVVYKVNSNYDVNSLIKSGEEALAAGKGTYSLEKLQAMFPQKQNDEAFLKMYYQKMIEYGSSPIEGIEAWLKVQTEIKESDVDMMEFLLENQKYLLLGGKAEAILKENYDEYWSIATRREENVLDLMKYVLANNTKSYAYKKSSPEWMRTFINAWEKLPQKKNRYGGNYKTGNRMEYEMDYFILSKNYDAFKTLAKSYLDSIMGAKSMKQIWAEDRAKYEEFKDTEYASSFFGKGDLKYYKKGAQADKQIQVIQKIGTYYLRYCSTSKDYKQLYKWLDYGAKLMLDDYRMPNLKALALYKQGKTKSAIEQQEIALGKLPKNSRYIGYLTTELEKMKKGESL